jgi:hypothetical protein
MPTDITGVTVDADFTVPLEIPADGDPVAISQYWQAAIQQAADRLAYLKNRFGGLAVLSDEMIYVDSADAALPRSRTLVVGASEAVSGATTPGTPHWDLTWNAASGSVNLSWISAANGAGLGSIGLIFPLRCVPSGAEITSISVRWDPGATGRSSKLAAGFYWSDTFDTSPAVPTLIGSVDQTETTSPEIRTISGLGSIISKDTKYHFVAISPGDDGATNFDRVYGISVTFNDPGPRNF